MLFLTVDRYHWTSFLFATDIEVNAAMDNIRKMCQFTGCDQQIRWCPSLAIPATWNLFPLYMVWSHKLYLFCWSKTKDSLLNRINCCCWLWMDTTKKNFFFAIDIEVNVAMDNTRKFCQFTSCDQQSDC